MTAKEMHIEFGLGFQKLGANSRRKFYPEEIDSLLNKAMDEFIADQVKETTDSKGFQHTQVDADKIRPLIVRDAILPASLVRGGSQWREYQSILPGDYAYLVSDRIALAKKCETSSTATTPRSAAIIPVPETTKTERPYYQIFTLASSPISLVLATEIPFSLYTGFSSKEQKFSAVSLLIETFYEAKRRSSTYDGYELYWEKAGNLYYPGKLLLIRPNSNAATLTIDAAVSNGTVRDMVMTQDTNPLYEEYPSRLTKASVIDNVLTTSFYKPQPSSPVSTITDGVLRVYSPTSHIVNMASITYVRKAARISLGLQRNCELATDFHRQVVDRAVAMAAKLVEQAALYQAQSTENKENK